jgi:hypothetical protein
MMIEEHSSQQEDFEWRLAQNLAGAMKFARAGVL